MCLGRGRCRSSSKRRQAFLQKGWSTRQMKWYPHVTGSQAENDTEWMGQRQTLLQRTARHRVLEDLSKVKMVSTQESRPHTVMEPKWDMDRVQEEDSPRWDVKPECNKEKRPEPSKAWLYWQTTLLFCIVGKRCTRSEFKQDKEDESTGKQHRVLCLSLGRVK